MSHLEILKKDERTVATAEFCKIWGVGSAVAEKLYFEHGCRSISDIKPHMLTKNQQTGLKYFSDFQQRMPREETGKIFEKVKEAAIQCFGKEIQVECCGSYRRGKPTCGDVDILISPNKRGANIHLDTLIVFLEKDGFLLERLSNPHRSSEDWSESYMGVCRVEELARRIDIKIYPPEQYAFALLYFTGSDYFNRSMRRYAQIKGFSLDDHALTQVVRHGKQKVARTATIPCKTEEEIFNALGIPFKAPAERDV